MDETHTDRALSRSYKRSILSKNFLEMKCLSLIVLVTALVSAIPSSADQLETTNLLDTANSATSQNATAVDISPEATAAMIGKSLDTPKSSNPEENEASEREIAEAIKGLTPEEYKALPDDQQQDIQKYLLLQMQKLTPEELAAFTPQRQQEIKDFVIHHIMLLTAEEIKNLPADQQAQINEIRMKVHEQQGAAKRR
jgi:hypothetical protein